MQINLNIVHNTELDRWIKERHYLHTLPPAAKIRMEFVVGKNRIGAMLWGNPTSPKLNGKDLLELTRMYFIDDTPKCVESKALSMARKYIRKHNPEIMGLIAYSSTGEHHEGTVYRADGWFFIAQSNGGGSWENRPNRKNTDLSPKIKFGRTP